MYKINDSLTERIQKEKRGDFWFVEILLIIALFMSIVLTLNTYVFFNVVVDGPSMLPTMRTGDVLVANRYKAVEQGSIIVIDGEKQDGQGGYYWLIKRAIAFEGDTVEIKNGLVYVNDKAIEEPYLKSGTLTAEHDWEKQTLGKGEVFYLGDNRTNSSDSRLAKYGTCQKEQIVGVVEESSFGWRWLNGFIYKIGNVIRGAN